MVTWSAISGDRYALQATTNLASPQWLDTGSVVTANDVVATNAVVPNADVACFYRIRLVP